MMMSNFKVIFLVLLLFALFSVASTLDFKDKKLEHEYNCKMVESGYYPEHFCK